MADNDREVSIHFDGKDHTFELTLGEVEEIEDAYNLPIEEVSFRRTKTVLLLVKFAKMRENPRADPNEIMRELRSRHIDVLEQPDGDPTPPKRARKAA
jgi:hypothetical protein